MENIVYVMYIRHSLGVSHRTKEETQKYLVKEARKHAAHCETQVDTERGKCGGWRSTEHWRANHEDELKVQEVEPNQETVLDISGVPMTKDVQYVTYEILNEENPPDHIKSGWENGN